MADAAPKATTTPRPRARAGAGATTKTATAAKTTAKPAPVNKAATKAATTSAEVADKGTEQTIRFTLDPSGDTKNYSKFTVPEGTACAGTLYVPLGAKEVRVLVIGVDDSE